MNSKNRYFARLTSFAWVGAGLLFTIASVVLPVRVFAGNLTKGFETQVDLPRGAIVSATTTNGNVVEKTTTNNDNLLAGVVVGSSDSLLDVLPKGSQIRVAVEGEVGVLVSDINGKIKKGDKLIASPLAGVAAVDYPPAPGATYIGIAGQDFDNTSSDAKKLQVSLTKGGTKDVSVGLITAKILISSRQSAVSKNILTSIGTQISGKDVSLLQVLAAMAIFLTATALCGVLLYGSIRGTFVSLGRNPLSRDSLLVGLARVLVLAIVVVAGGATVAYFVLTI